MIARPLFVFLVCAITWLAEARLPGAEQPNILLILADDFGVGDIQAHFPSNKIVTPHLDRLVHEGLSFTDAHSPSAVCSPTRYGILTGRYAWRTRLQEWVIASYEPPLIAADRPTLPSFLRQHGYHTACIGKWHLGWQWPGPQPSRMTDVRNGQKNLHWDFTKPIRGGPTERGFDYYFGPGLPNQPPFTYIENDRVAIQPTASLSFDTNEGVALPNGFIGCPAAPNWRMKDVVPELTRRAVDYIHARGKTEHPFFLFYSMTSPHEPVVPSDKFRGKSGIAPIADFVMETDWSAGRVIQAIDDAGLRDNTIVIFTADNGHSHYTGWNDLVNAGHLPSGPYRGHKGEAWEGGHRVPLIVRSPPRCAANAQTSQLVCLTDFFATFAELFGAQLPKHGAEDSLSFLPDILGNGRGKRQALVSHSNFGEFAYREGPWKLILRMAKPKLEQSRGMATVPELYNLSDDLAETNNRAADRADIVSRLRVNLRQLVEQGATRSDVVAANDAKVDFAVTQRRRWTP